MPSSTATILLPLATSTPTANMRTPPDVLLQWQTAFPHRRFYLFADSSVPDGTLPAQIERCTMEGWLTDSVASAKLLGWSVRPLPFHCTTLAMSCPAPRLAASVLGLLYSNRGAFWVVALSLEAALSKSLLFPEGKREVARRSRDGGIRNSKTARLRYLKIKSCNFE